MVAPSFLIIIPCYPQDYHLAYPHKCQKHEHEPQSEKALWYAVFHIPTGYHPNQQSAYPYCLVEYILVGFHFVANQNFPNPIKTNKVIVSPKIPSLFNTIVVVLPIIKTNINASQNQLIFIF